MPQHRRLKLLYFNQIKAFTLMEVLIALSIIAISLVPLLHLLVRSISVMDSASCLSRASLIGNAKLAEVIGSGYPETGTESGVVSHEGSNVVFKWQVSVTDVRTKELADIGIDKLRRANVAVKWNEGQRQKQVSLSTYITIDQIATGAPLRESDSLQK